jgi:hypothetical protein
MVKFVEMTPADESSVISVGDYYIRSEKIEVFMDRFNNNIFDAVPMCSRTGKSRPIFGPVF